ncbi:ketopantoate reductase family protein [Labrys monachus]|uniref:2-dehydropantoate 2-reductase n=1 Tax=Labrys monachus TaxID=217067 RepID=A0ABU0FBR3_9HYPH|nr:2-dehydropantoate 2-reductase [Labrys monachus]MDQ0392045.1 2-dehydropantoate 2-reductase [Labrys monachus]
MSGGPILVWGAGAIGATLGAAFIRAGEEVVFVDAAADHVAAINAAGLAITGPVDPHHVTARAFVPEAVEGTYDRIVLAVKSHHTAATLGGVARHLAPGGFVVSAQNGLEEHRIAAAIGAERTVGCFVNFGADYMEPGVVLYGGRGAVVVGEIDGRLTPRLDEVFALFRKFDRDAIRTANIWGYLWAKLVYGAMLFATALTNDSIADVLAIERHRPMLVKLAHEIQAVAAAEGIRLEAFNGFDPAAFAPDAPYAVAARSFDEMVAHNRKSAKSHSGIWRDLAVRKRRTEVDAQLGPIIEFGRRHGVATPIVEGVIERIHDIEEGRRQLDLAWLDELDAIADAGAAA